MRVTSICATPAADAEDAAIIAFFGHHMLGMVTPPRDREHKNETKGNNVNLTAQRMEMKRKLEGKHFNYSTKCSL